MASSKLNFSRPSGAHSSARIIGLSALLLILAVILIGCGSTRRTPFVTGIHGPDVVLKNTDSTFSIGYSGTDVEIHWSTVPTGAGVFRKAVSGYEGVGFGQGDIFDTFSGSGSGFGFEMTSYQDPEVLFQPANAEVGSTIQIVAVVNAAQFEPVILKKWVDVLD